MVSAVSTSVVPKISVIIGGSFGAGHYAMCGKAYDPRFLFAWPTARYAVMGGAAAANTLAEVKAKQMERAGQVVDEAAKKATDAGATHFAGKPDDNPHAFYEVKYKNPDGVIFDLTHNGWRGAVKEVMPAEAEKVPAE